MPDDASRSPGLGVRPMESAVPDRARAGRQRGHPAQPRHRLAGHRRRPRPRSARASRARGHRGEVPADGRRAARSGRSTTRPSSSTPPRPSSTPSRPTRRAPSARRSSTPSSDGEMFVNLGPQHPSTHGVLRVVLKIDGEQVVDLDPVLGYLHRGVEKICENGDWHHAISNCDPLEYIASMFSEAMPVLVAEKLLDLEVPAARRVHPRPRLGAQPHLQPRPVHRLAGARPGRPDAHPVRLHRARRDRRDARRADGPEAAVQLPAHRRRQRRPQPRVPEPPRRLDEPRREAHRGAAEAHQRERDLRRPHARPGRARPRDGAPDVRHGAAAARHRHALRRPPGASLQRLPGARVRDPDAHRGRLLRALPAAPRRDQAEHPHHRPGAPPDARRAGDGQAAAPAAGAARAAPGSPSRARAASTAPTASATAPTSPSGCASTTRRTSTSRRSAS